ncbi:MAG: type I DNA topoisomerase [Lachnospiraceae bacterium]|nr:type I DNA topoisomerase [Lachnospiraceae bacterium]MBR4605075.1 type I DNA topoisomerase [Lachnospiraceae bacterium]MBR6152287.1 type I DNA topoisomerase [Lachnospiraceae bacterium]
MAKNLVIVESPSKIKTIKKFLGTNFEVVASNGHVRDLPKSQLGFSPEDDYEPKYITIRGKGDILANLRKEVKKADKIYLATDPDREGEAISWHLYHALKLGDKKVYRITFNEITKNVVKESLKNAREIDMNLVDAQQARRMLDRMVGYRISPLLWAKIKRGLSAGRVQSVALRIICDREAEIENFTPEEYWSLEADLKIPGAKKPVVAKYYGSGSSKKELNCEEDVNQVLKDIKDAAYVVKEVKTGERMKKAPLPFTTSTLQQEASKVLNFSTSKTMNLAQQLYEGVEIKGEGTIGLITYLRTDSVRVSEEAAQNAAAYVEKHYGKEYLAQKTADPKKAQRIQDAHEAIRPTDIERLPIAVKDQLPRDLFRLYQLIWQRFAASQMAPAKYETTSVKVSANKSIFTMAASKLKFDGFTCVYVQKDEEEETGTFTGALEKGMTLECSGVRKEQHFTQPPAHFTEASLVKTLEELGIGRPSTYAPTIGTILGRRYIAKEGKNLIVTELGEVVNQMMVEAFPTIVDVNFTANLEALLDGVEEGTVKWKTIIENFYPDLDKAVIQAQKDLSEVKVADEESDEVCEKCGRRMVIKYGSKGKFLACPGFPECQNAKPYYEKTGVTCPKCGKDIVIKRTQKGRRYYGCIGNPECDFMVWNKPSGERCPKCGNALLEKGNRLVCADEKCGYSILKIQKDTENKQ